MKKINFIAVITLFILTLLSVPSFSETKGMYILCYHAFLEKKDPYSFSMDQFRDQLQRLKKSGFNFVSFDDAINGRINGTKNIMITIDDGNKSVYEAYYSIMKPMGIKPVLGIYPAIIGRMHYAMTWPEINKLADDGCYIASHGYHHMYFSTKYYNKEPESFKKEIYYSKKVLEEKLGRKIETMIYPFGVSSDIAIAELKNAGYKYAMSLDQKFATVPPADNFMIPRYMLTKPNQKWLIAYFSKNAEKMTASAGTETAATTAQTSTAEDKNMVTINNYPQRISRMVMNDVIFMPDKKIAAKKAKHLPKFKPYVHKSAMNGKVTKNAKKQTPLHKKNTAEKESRTSDKRNTMIDQVKEEYFAVLDRFSSFIFSLRELTTVKIAFLKTKAFSLFS